MTFNPDIVRKIQTDFSDQTAEVFETFRNAIEGNES